MKNVHIIKHPLIQDKLTRMRDENTPSRDFRFILKELSTLMAFEVTRKMKTDPVTVKTPLNLKAEGVRVDQSEIVLVPIF
ncbi:MAG: uracil phosphoribosyltransferase, partial [Desulfosalsimonas sp.]